MKREVSVLMLFAKSTPQKECPKMEKEEWLMPACVIPWPIPCPQQVCYTLQFFGKGSLKEVGIDVAVIYQNPHSTSICKPKSLTHNFKTTDMELWKFGCNRRLVLTRSAKKLTTLLTCVCILKQHFVLGNYQSWTYMGRLAHTHTWEHSKLPPLPAQLAILNHIILPLPPPLHTHTSGRKATP